MAVKSISAAANAGAHEGEHALRVERWYCKITRRTSARRKSIDRQAFPVVAAEVSSGAEVGKLDLTGVRRR